MPDAPGEQAADVRGWRIHMGESVCCCELWHLSAGLSIARGSACCVHLLDW